MLRTNRITVRGESFEVRELSGKDMVAVRKLLSKDEWKPRLEGFVAFLCCVDPKFKTEDDAHELPMAVLSAISEEAFRLGREEPTEAPKAPTTA
jgi:hypothetical protein